MVEEEVKESEIEKAEDTYFMYWMMQIKYYYYEERLHLLLLGKKPDNLEDADWNLLDRHTSEACGEGFIVAFLIYYTYFKINNYSIRF